MVLRCGVRHGVAIYTSVKGHGLVIPERRFAARHVSDTTDPIDDAMIVPVAALVVSHRLPISLAVWVFGTA